MPIGATPISEGEDHVYVLLFDHDKNNKAIGDSYNNCFWRIEGTDKTEAIKCYINNNSIYLTNSGYTNNPALLESLLTNPESIIIFIVTCFSLYLVVSEIVFKLLSA